MPVYQTEKKWKKPTAVQREFHDVAKIAVFERVKVSETSKHLLIKTTSIKEYHYMNGRVEETSNLTETTARIPKSLLKDVVEYADYIVKHPDKKKRRKK